MLHFGKRHSKPGAAPGTLVAPTERPAEAVRIEVFDYGPEHLEETEGLAVDDTFRFRESPHVTWINVAGLHDIELLRRLGDHFGLHALALEDVVNTIQRPKLEDYEKQLFIVMKLIHLGEDLSTEQLSMFLGTNYVITFQERPGDVFHPVRERIRRGRGRIRRAGADYLAYALIDAMVDQFFPILERYGERIEELEDELIEDPAQATLAKIHAVKKELLLLRRATWPQREVINAFVRQEGPLVRKETRIFLRDCYDHSIQIMDILETYRDLASGMLDVYLSSVSNRMNEVMKVLTIMASIFIPLSFLAGVFGMNFNADTSPWNMPELDWYWGYPMFWFLIVAVAGGMLYYFRRKGWL